MNFPNTIKSLNNKSNHPRLVLPEYEILVAIIDIQ